MRRLNGMRTAVCTATAMTLLAIGALQAAPDESDYPPNPPRYWQLSAYILPGDAEGHFVLRLDRHARDLFSFTVQPRDIRLQVLDGRGRPADMAAVIQAPADDPLPQTVDKYGSRSVTIPIVVTPDQAPAGMYTLRARTRPLAAKGTNSDELRAISTWPVDQRFYWLPSATAERTLKFLRTKYLGKRVFLYPGLSVEVVSDSDVQARFSPEGLTEATIKNISLSGGPPQMTAIGATDEGSGYIRSRLFTVELSFKKPPGYTFASFSATGPPIAESELRAGLSPPGARYLCHFAGLWDFERYFALKHPFAANSKWPRSVRQAIRDQEIRKGMTPDQVAWAYGWPDEFGTVSEMRHWTSWRYDSAPPFSFWVTFARGRVVKAEPDGTLP